MSIGWGIIGIGTHAGLRMAPALRRAADTQRVAVCSRSLERANDFASKYGFMRAYDNLPEMLKDSQLDVLYVATPNSLHAEHTMQAAEAGKHVLCEKPMAITENDCQQMIASCEKNNVKLCMCFQNRYHPAHVEAHRLIQAGEIGKIYAAKAQYCHGRGRGLFGQGGWRSDLSMAGGGALMGTGLHPIDLLRFLLDSEVEEIRALCDPSTPNTLEDMVYAFLKFQNGAHGVVVAGNLVFRSDNDAVLYGSEAKITCKGTVGMPLQGELFVEGDSINLRMAFPTDDIVSGCYIQVVEAFNRSIEENTELSNSGYNGLQMVKIANALLESSRLGKAVKI
ncbi:Gfo/Idh/MocA family protein [Chloroflexota bacterium]